MNSKELEQLMKPGAEIPVKVSYTDVGNKIIKEGWRVLEQTPENIFREEEKAIGEKGINIVLPEIRGKTKKDILTYLSIEGLRPASMSESISFFDQYPELLKQFTFVGLVNPSILGAMYVVPTFEYIDGKKRIGYVALDARFTQNRLIAVKK